MAINTEQAIAWMAARQGKVTYSMDYRNGPSSYDCSSSVYFALRSAGASDNGWAVNTEYMHDWLIKNGYQLVAENTSWIAQRGDIFIWGQRGASAGAGGHAGIFVDADNIIHCNYGYNGITVNNHDEIWSWNGMPYVYAYRYVGKQSEIPNVATSAISQFEHELDVNTPLTNSNMPYYEATLSEDYYVESKPDANSHDKELLVAGTRVRVYEKLNGWSRVNHPQSAQWVEDSYLIDATDM
ncbi:peptidoglycan amidohydrolase family protein [Streptococcus iniae]|uniref:peptidoglycan amidohydrolase family protein n=1 Tax=Streptococcus iniae TaxID=1346 RepID=UPI000EF7010C|nr:peptidoglycan amidohydrolase family protein [Streptococcus iniae]RLV19007.1 holin [Streptococcus iniae]